MKKNCLGKFKLLLLAMVCRMIISGVWYAFHTIAERK